MFSTAAAPATSANLSVTAQPILEVRDVHTTTMVRGQPCNILDGVSFSLLAGKMLGIVGESGCGKSMTALAIMGLLPRPQVRISSGSINLLGEELIGQSERELRRRRGTQMAMIFQEPMASLNPVRTIGDQVMEAIRAHQPMPTKNARAIGLELLDRVRIRDPRHTFDNFPHRLSGGMCQRVSIAMALAARPRLLIADEPTTALDVSVQAQILELLATLQQEEDLAVLLISHDLGVVAGYADEVAVMYAGKIVEQADVDTLFASPKHPYTIGLMRAAPRLAGHRTAERLVEIPGMVPALGARPAGCAFVTRCDVSMSECAGTMPKLGGTEAGHKVACLLHKQRR
jgi:peptide/nickel transport system ATP-binding protein